MKRKRLSRRKSKRIFRKGARVRRINRPIVMRGGTRL